MGDVSQTISTHSVPHLKTTSGGHQLIVNGQPFLILGAELQNSSFSSPEFMLQVWPRLEAHKVNTVLANVSWEDIEPQEGVFDFSSLDENILAARRHDLHLILLWFGAFKNGKSTYAPGWVKTNPTRFPRMNLRDTRNTAVVTNVLSIFDPEVVKADAAAFEALMRHIREIDNGFDTLLMVQVENEVGLLGGSLDTSPQADAIFHDPVPKQLVKKLRDEWGSLHPTLQRNLKVFQGNISQIEPHPPSWPALFGDSITTDELFMAYHYAKYVETVAKAGKEKHPLPMFTNVWQNYADEDADKSQPVIVGGGGQPGDYPSGGGVINVLDIWQLFAPSLDFIAPDLYLNDYNAVCAKYKHRGQPLFIPEQRRDEYGARRIWSAYGTYHALCASPFGIDTLDEVDSPWTKHYGLLNKVSTYVLAAQANPTTSYGFFFDEVAKDGSATPSLHCDLGRWKLTIERSFVFGKPGPGFGMIIQLSDSRFLLVGEGFQVHFRSADENSVFSGILSFEEKVWCSESGRLKRGRILNGDETRSGERVVMPGERPDPGDFPISITVPARTRIAECEVYYF